MENPPATLENHLPDDEDPVRVAYAGAKRRIAALEDKLQALQEEGTRRKSQVLCTISTLMLMLMRKNP